MSIRNLQGIKFVTLLYFLFEMLLYVGVYMNIKKLFFVYKEQSTMVIKKSLFIIGLMPLLIGNVLYAAPIKEVPQAGLISNYGFFQNVWRAINYIQGKNRKNDILEAIRTNNKEAFKNNFMKGDLVEQSDIVVEIILSNNLEFLRILEDEMNVDIKGVIDHYETRNNRHAYELPQALAQKHGSQAEEMFEYLHEHNFALNAKNENGDTIAVIALEKRDKKLFNHLLKTIIRPSESNNNGESLAHKAAYIEDNEYLITVLRADTASVNSKDHAGKTPLHIATEKSDPKKITELINHGADVSISDNNGVTPAHQAAAGECSVQSAKIIFNAPTIDPKVVNNEGKSVRKVLKDTHHRDCLKGIEKICNGKTKTHYSKRCNQMTAIHHAFQQSRFIHLKDKTQKLIEEQNHLFEQQAQLCEEEIERREKAIQDELEKIRLEKEKITEKLALQRTELSEPHELIASLKQEFEQENATPDLNDINDTKEKFTYDSH